MQLSVPGDLAESELFTSAVRIARVLSEAGHRTLFAGGCVRDILRGTMPGDIDIATEALPQTVLSLFRRTIPVGEHFGVVIVMEGDIQFEVATFRADIGIADGRHPERIAFCGEREDAQRRDFTINGMFYDPATGELLDYVGGENDLQRGIIRTIGSPAERFAEDYLRLLRAVRFAARFDYLIEQSTIDAIRHHADGIFRISKERIFAELDRMLTGPRPAAAIRLLDITGLLERVLPDIAALKGVEQPPQFHPEGDVYTHVLMMLEQIENVPSVLAWSVLLHDVGKPATMTVTDRIRFNNHDMVGATMTRRILSNLKCPGSFIDDVVACVENHMRFMHVPKMRLSTLKRFLARSTIRTEIELHRIDCGASHGDTSNCAIVEEQLASMDAETIRPKPLLTGRDLIGLGLTPGPLFGTILDAAYDLQLENALTTREDALNWVQNHHGDFSNSPGSTD